MLCPPPRELGPECLTAPTENPSKRWPAGTPLTGVTCSGRASVTERRGRRRRRSRRREEVRKRRGLAMEDVGEGNGVRGPGEVGVLYI